MHLEGRRTHTPARWGAPGAGTERALWPLVGPTTCFTLSCTAFSDTESRRRRNSTSCITPHDLRHSCASLAVSAGVNVLALQRMLGHTSAKVTLDTYAD